MVTLDKHIWQIVPTDRDQGRSAQIVSSMLEMAQSLHLPIVIEGVETDEQANMLRHMAPATLRVSSTTAPCRRRILRHCSMVAITTDTLVRKTPPSKGVFVSIS